MTLAFTFSTTMLPTLSDLSVNEADCDFVPSAKTYVRCPTTSESLTVPVRFSA